MENVTAIVKTFMRPEKFELCLKSLVSAGLKKIIVSFDGPEEYLERHRRVIGKYQRNVTIRFLELPFNVGLAATRNRMIEKVNTDYILMVDDDNYVPLQVLEMVRGLSQLPEDIGGVAMGWLPAFNPLPQMDAWDFEIVNRILFKTWRSDKQRAIINGNAYMLPFDFIPNQVVFRRKLFDDVQWDEHYVISREHEDFYLTCKKETDWKFGICTSMYSIHDPGGTNEYVREYRGGEECDKSAEYFLKKWNLKGIAPLRYSDDYTSLFYDAAWQVRRNLDKNRYIRWKLETNQALPDDVFQTR